MHFDLSLKLVQVFTFTGTLDHLGRFIRRLIRAFVLKFGVDVVIVITHLIIAVQSIFVDLFKLEEVIVLLIIIAREVLLIVSSNLATDEWELAIQFKAIVAMILLEEDLAKGCELGYLAIDDEFIREDLWRLQ